MANFFTRDVNEPFKGDLFNRSMQSKRLYQLISINEENFVTCIDSRFGRGKTTFLDMLNSYILSMNNEREKLDDIIPIYYDAWENDYFDSPFISLISCLDEVVETKDHIGLKEVKNATGKIAIGYVKMMTNGVLDLNSLLKAADKSNSKRFVIE